MEDSIVSAEKPFRITLPKPFASPALCFAFDSSLLIFSAATGNNITKHQKKEMAR